jgi:hypothetical protein
MSINPDELVPLLTKEELDNLDFDAVRDIALEQNRKLKVLLDAVETMDYQGDRAKGISDPYADPRITQLCDSLGYGAIMDAVARMWFLKDAVGAFVIGPCAGTMKQAIEYIEGKVKLPYRLARDWGIQEQEPCAQGVPKGMIIDKVVRVKPAFGIKVTMQKMEEVKEAYNAGLRVVVVTAKTDMANTIGQALALSIAGKWNDVMYCTSHQSQLERYEALEKAKILVGTVQVLCQGVNLGMFDKVVICCNDSLRGIEQLLASYNGRRALMKMQERDDAT